MTSPCLFAALQYASIGWQVLPLHAIDAAGKCTCKNPKCSAPGKHPLTQHGLQDATKDPTIISQWWSRWPFANVGIATGTVSNLVVLDIDPRHNGDDTLFDLEVSNGKLPLTLEALTGGGGKHILFSHPGRRIPNDSKGIIFGQGIDVRGDGGYIVAPPSIHVSKNQYDWEASSDPITDKPIPMPGWMLQKFPTNNNRASGQSNNGTGKKAKSGNRNITLTQIGGSLRRQGLAQPQIEATLLDLNKKICNPPLPDAEVIKISKSVGRYSAKNATPTDDDLAEEYLEKHPDTVYGLSEFRRYENGIWGALNERQLGDEILEIMQDAKGLGYKPSYFKIRSVLEIVRMMTDIPANQWNADPDLLVCRNGTLKISTRTLRTPKKEDYITSGVPYDFYASADDSFWLKFLDDTIPLAAEFLQEFAGYSLTTDCQYEIAVWLYGPRGSGKSTFIEGLKAMLGTKAGQLGLAQIENSRFGLTDLPSKTLLFSTEQPSEFIKTGHILNALISGEEVIMERKFKDPEAVIPHAKILWAMNDLPRVRDASSGLFRRVKVVEFPELTIPRDPRVKLQIKEMGAAILNWSLDGLDRLMRRGCFDIPDYVKNATDEFETSNDVVKLFVSECCDVGQTYEVKAGELYRSYAEWCIANGHKPKSSTALGYEDWKRMGFKRMRKNTGNFYTGIRIKQIFP